MNKNLREVFSRVNLKPNAGLADNIWNSIVMREKRIAKLKLGLFSLIGMLSLVGAVPVFKTLITDFTQSGFYEYFSLIFSDSGLILSIWREFVFSLIESLPVLSIILSLTLIFIFFLSLKYAMKQIGRGQLLLLPI